MNRTQIVCYGAGVDSTAMLIELTKRGFIMDFIFFSDTGGEKPETYAFIPRFSSWLEKNGQPAIKILKYQREDGVEETLEEELKRRKALPPIAYGFKSCSEKYKIRPINKFLRQNCKHIFNSEEKPIKYIGFDLTERRRMKEDPDGIFENRYPLIEWNITRDMAQEIIKNEGFCLPPKSSCFFCPNMKAKEVLRLPEDLKQRAIEMERNAKDALTNLEGLGRTYSWERLINADKKQQKLFDDLDLDLYNTPCECVD
jgi:hypothetical protein